jgi:hypothetical protein
MNPILEPARDRPPDSPRLVPESLPHPPSFVMPPILRGRAEMAAAAGAVGSWLWHGYLAPGAVTLLTGRWKAGKTTLASLLLARMATGGQLAGLALAAGNALVVSEENPGQWLERLPAGESMDHVGWMCRPFQGPVRPAQWQAFLAGLADLHQRDPFALLLIDPLAAFLPGRNENNATCMLEALTPLQRLTCRGVSTLILHHPGKGEPPLGQAARGSSALSASVDILLEMRLCPNPADDDRRRRLHAFSRYRAAPRERIIEWTADGSDYVCAGTFAEDDFARHWETVRAILFKAMGMMTRRDILQQWPNGSPPHKVTVSRCLNRAVEEGLVFRDGLGRKKDPYRYRLPGWEERWSDPRAICEMLGLEWSEEPPRSPEVPPG